MNGRTRAFEIGAVVVIALALLLGGVPLLVGIATGPLHRIAPYVLVVLAGLQVVTMRRDYASGRANARLLVTRDMCFLLAIAAAVVFVIAQPRWAAGSTLAPLEFGLALDVLSRLVPTAPAA